MARIFAGGTDEVDFGNNSVLNIHGDLAIGVWFRPQSNSFGAIVERVYAGSTIQYNAAYELFLKGGSGAWDIGYVHDTGSNRGPGTALHTFDTNIPNDTWAYIGISRDATAKTITLWKGVNPPLTSLQIVETWAYSQNPDGGTDPLVHLCVGTLHGGPGAYGEGPFIGRIGPLYIYNRKLTLAEHTLIATCAPPQQGLQLATLLSPTSPGNSPEVDISPNALSGTVVGTTQSNFDPCGPAPNTGAIGCLYFAR